MITVLLFMLSCRAADLVLHGVFRLVCKGLHYDQGQVEILRRVSTDCDKVQYVCVVCVRVCVCVCCVRACARVCVYCYVCMCYVCIC